MQIKQQALVQQIQKKTVPVYVLIGQDHYLINESLYTIKSAIKKKYDSEEKTMSIQSAEDWSKAKNEANSYSLFSDTVILTLYFDKKSIDASGKKILTEYLKSINPKCFIIIQAPDVPAKQLQWLSTNEQVVVVLSYPLNSEAMKNWMVSELKKNFTRYDPLVPDLILQYTQGNMLACSQVIEKIMLSNTPESYINAQVAQEHLSDQCDHSLFELIDVCLMGKADKAIQILRQAENNKTEATLILWMLSQEIRNLLQLSWFMRQNVNLQTASTRLKIWPQRMSLYSRSLKRLNDSVLQKLLYYCQSLDEQIKSNSNTQIWNSFENLAIGLCIGEFSCTA